MSAPFCKDCKFFGEMLVQSMVFDSCNHPDNRFVDYVRGEGKPRDPSWLRNLPSSDVCGPSGKWFEEKDANPGSR